MEPGKAKSVDGLVAAAVRGELDVAEALRLCRQSPELVTLALLAAAKRIAEQDVTITQLQGTAAKPAPSTPSGIKTLR